ncbi:MAG TPA: dockerin type I repeat-containing protein, partial [Planctomycetota bacterium]|nr:dockerin type I repeat-containing protein [Planctomycetota bacterium]
PIVFGPYSGKLANEGEELLLLDAGPGHPATIDYLKYESDGDWPELKPGESLELTGVSRDRDNDPPQNWKVSRPGGTPGLSEPVFLRTDSNGDGRIDITDVVFLLAYLFQGGPPPTCLDAADSNDDGELSITDALHALQFLFQGGSSPPPPHPLEGTDPTADDLECG